MGVFIEVKVQSEALVAELIQHIVQLCPVDIFAIEGGRLIARPEQEDECTLCELCLKAAPARTILIRKLYSGETLTSGERAAHG